jgi:hypothetical protein
MPVQDKGAKPAAPPVDNAAAVDDMQSVTDTPPLELTAPPAAKPPAELTALPAAEPPVYSGKFVAPPVDDLPAIGTVPVVVTNPAVPAVP